MFDYNTKEKGVSTIRFIFYGTSTTIKKISGNPYGAYPNMVTRSITSTGEKIYNFRGSNLCDEGENSINNFVEVAMEILQEELEILGELQQLWIYILGHSRGAVAAALFAKKSQRYIKEKKFKLVKIKLTLMDSYSGPMAKHLDPKARLDIKSVDESVVYVSSKSLVNITIQLIRNADHIIIVPYGHNDISSFLYASTQGVDKLLYIMDKNMGALPPRGEKLYKYFSGGRAILPHLTAINKENMSTLINFLEEKGRGNRRLAVLFNMCLMALKIKPEDIWDSIPEDFKKHKIVKKFTPQRISKYIEKIKNCHNFDEAYEKVESLFSQGGTFFGYGGKKFFKYLHAAKSEYENGEKEKAEKELKKIRDRKTKVIIRSPDNESEHTEKKFRSEESIKWKVAQELIDHLHKNNI